MLRFVQRLGEAWHSTDSVLYLERLVEEKEIRIQELRAELESFKNPYVNEENKAMPKPISGYEPWSVLKARINRQEREKEKKNVDKSSEGPN